VKYIVEERDDRFFCQSLLILTGLGRGDQILKTPKGCHGRGGGSSVTEYLVNVIVASEMFEDKQCW